MAKISIKMIPVYRRHSGIIIMAQPMPYSVFFAYPHMTHLYRKKIFQHRLPHTTIINVLCHPEYGRTRVSITHKIQTFFPYIRKIKCHITVTQKFSPFFTESSICRYFTPLCQLIKNTVCRQLFSLTRFQLWFKLYHA